MCRAVLVLVGIMLSFVPGALDAQVATGSYPYATVDSFGTDSVNVGNLNVHIDIPVFTKTGRGIPFNYNLAYDSSVWSLSGATWQPAANNGWSSQTVVGRC